MPGQVIVPNTKHYVSRLPAPVNPRGVPLPPMPGMPPVNQRPISSIWSSYPGGAQGPGQGPALAAQQNPFASMRDNSQGNFSYLMQTLGKYMR